MKDLLKAYLPEVFFDKQSLKASLTFIFIAFIMLVVEYFGWQGPFIKNISKLAFFKGMIQSKNDLFFGAQVFTSLSFFVFFLLLPLIFNALFPLNNTVGLGLPKENKSFKPYLILVLIMVPVLFLACSYPSFYRFYPLYRPESLKMFFLYELVYLTQFICVEFFFRGFGLFRSEKILPKFGVFVMVIPYSFIHIHKPFGEALGSIIAGIVLGNLALKSKSIWPGVIVHSIIALTADTLGLYYSGELLRLF